MDFIMNKEVFVMSKAKAPNRPDAYAPGPLPQVPVVVPASSVKKRNLAGPYSLNSAPPLEKLGQKKTNRKL